MTTAVEDEHPAHDRVRRWRPPGALVSAACALALVIILFPELFLAGGSFSAVPFDTVLGQHLQDQTSQVYPDVGIRTPTSGVVDVGARTWQFEPTIRYMASVLRDRTNPLWNPYQASGSLGPETLDGMQLSPFVLLVAVLGGSSTAFTVGLLALILLSFYCLQQFFVRSLGLHRLAGIGACVVFMLNGWATSTFTDVTCVPYLLFPIVLYALVEFQRRIGPGRFFLAVIAYIAMFTSTFPPGQVLMIGMVTVVAAVVDVWWRREAEADRPLPRRAVEEVGRQAVVPAIALVAVSFLVLPALDAYRRGGTDITAYSQQVLVTQGAERWLILPSYLLSVLQPLSPIAQSITYLGVAPLILTAAAAVRARGLVRWLLVALGVLFVVGLSEHMGLPVLKSLGDLPGLRTILNSYWACLTGATLALAFGLAVHVAATRGLSLSVTLALCAAMVGVLLAVAARAGWPVHAELAAVVIGAVLEAVIVLVWLGRRDLISRTAMAALAVAVVALELGGYANHIRSRRVDDEAHLTGYVQYVRSHVGDGRILDAGRNTILGDWPSVLSVREVGTLDIMQIPWYRDFYQSYVDPGSPGKFLTVPRDYETPFKADPRALDLLSVRYIVVDDDDHGYRAEVAARYPLAYRDRAARVSVFANPGAFPRAYLSPALARDPVRLVSGSSRPRPPLPYTMATTLTQDPMLLAQAGRAGVPSAAPGGSATGAGQVRITDDGSTTVRVDVVASKPSVLVLADTYHPNWSVTVNGVPQHLGQVDSVVRGVVVPAGHSEVVFHYHSKAWALGLVISAFTVVALVVGCAVWAWRRRRARGGEPVEGSVAAGPEGPPEGPTGGVDGAVGAEGADEPVLPGHSPGLAL